MAILAAVSCAAIPLLWTLVQQPRGIRPAPAAEANASAPSAASSAQEAQELLRQAVAAVERHNSVSARLRQQVNLYGQQLAGTGIYLQGPSQTRTFRLEFKLLLDDEITSVQHVCDGNHLWIAQQGPQGAPVVSCVAVRQVPNATAVDEPAVAAMTSRLGGLPKLLESLDTNFRFTSAVQASAAGRPMVRLQGEWRSAQLVRLLPNQKPAIEAGQPADLSRLPRFVPDQVIVHLGRDGLFPYRIEYRRISTVTGQAPSSPEPLVIIEFFDPKFNEPIDPRLFVFESGNLPIDGRR